MPFGQCFLNTNSHLYLMYVKPQNNRQLNDVKLLRQLEKKILNTEMEEEIKEQF